MLRLLRLTLLLCLVVALPARAGIIFTPRLSEYARLAPGPYDDLSLLHTRIEDVYDQHGRKTTIGVPLIPPGGQVEIVQLMYKALWVGHPLRDSGIPVLEDHALFCRVIGSLGWQQASSAFAERGRKFGYTSGGSGPGDLFGLCGVYGVEHRWGALKFNGLFATTLKFPVGRYDRDALLNTGTNYWSTIPQLALHAELAGRLYLDATVAWQFNGRNDEPAYGGLTPTRPADVRNAEANLAWKFNEHWFADLGVSHRRSVGRNHYDKVDVHNVEPLEAETACQTLSLDATTCSATRQFFVQSRPGSYADGGVRGTLLTAGLSYVYRSSSVFSLRLLQPAAGRGGQVDVPFDLYLAVPDVERPGSLVPAPVPVAQTTTRLNGVQEAASMSASPLIELRLVYLFWAP